jgi:hypothetical protein
MSRLPRLFLVVVVVTLISTSVNAQGNKYFVSDPTNVFTVTLPQNVYGEGFYLSPTNVDVYAPSIYASDNQDWQLYLTFYSKDPLVPSDSFPLEYMIIVGHWFSGMSVQAATDFPGFNRLFLTCSSAWMLSPVEEILRQAGTFQQQTSFQQIYGACEQHGLMEEAMNTDGTFEITFAIPGNPETARLTGLVSKNFIILATHYDYFSSGNSQPTVDRIINSLQFDSYKYDPYVNPSVYSQFMTVLQANSNLANSPQNWIPAPPTSNFDECLGAASGGDYGDYSVCLNNY